MADATLDLTTVWDQIRERLATSLSPQQNAMLNLTRPLGLVEDTRAYLDELPGLTADLPTRAPVAPGWRALAATAALQARTSALGVPTWSAADPRRRRLVVLVGVLLTLLLLAALVAAAATGGSDGPPPFVPRDRRWG